MTCETRFAESGFPNKRLIFLSQCDERLSFCNDVCGELARVTAADILCRMDRSGRDKQYFASFEGYWRLALYLVFQQALKHIYDLFARMLVLAERRSWSEVNAYLDDFPANSSALKRGR